MLCCQGFEVNHYDFTLGRLAYENLRSVQDKGNALIININISMLWINKMVDKININ